MSQLLHSIFFPLKFLHLKIQRANIIQERWFLSRHADERKQRQLLSSVYRFLLLLYSGIYDMNNSGVEEPHIFTETSFNVIICKVWQKPWTIWTICTGFRLPVWYQQFVPTNPTEAVLISLNHWCASPQRTRFSYPHSAVAQALLWQNSGRFPKKEAGSEQNEDQIKTDSQAGFSLACGKGKSLIRHQLLWPRWPVGAVSPKPLGFHLWMWNPARLKEGHHAQSHLSCLNLHFPSATGESGCAQAPLWDVSGIPPPMEGEMGGGRDLLWYYLKAKYLSEEGCEAHGKFIFFRMCFQCERQ